MKNVRPLLALVSLLCSAPALAAQAQAKPYHFGMSAGTMSIAPAAASTQLVGTRSWGMQFDGGMTIGRYLVAGVDFAPQFLSDKAPFTQNTTAGEKSSTVTLLYFSAMAGPRTSPMRIIPGVAPMALGLFGGVSSTTGERGVENCTGCASEDIRIAGGTFVQPTLLFGEGRTRFRLSDRYFFGGEGIRQVLSVGMEIGAK